MLSMMRQGRRFTTVQLARLSGASTKAAKRTVQNLLSSRDIECVEAASVAETAARYAITDKGLHRQKTSSLHVDAVDGDADAEPRSMVRRAIANVPNSVFMLGLNLR